MLDACDLFAIMAFERNMISALYRSKACLDRLVICHALRILALCNTYYFRWSFEFLLFYNLEVADLVDSCFRGDKSQFVELFVLKELICYFDDAFLAVNLASQIDADCNLTFNSLKIKKIKGFIYVFSRDMVQYSTILQCAYY